MTQDKNTVTITRLLEDLFEVVAVYTRGNQIVFSLEYRFARDISSTLITDRLRAAGYDFSLDEHDDQLLLTINPTPKLRIPALNIVLFAVTLFTVYFVPVFLRRLGTFPTFSEAINSTLDALAAGEGIEFTLALISILFVHEMGHYVASKRRNIVTSWPYFIPAPNIIGTFGAVIKSKSPFWNRRDLIEVGAAGPIAGWIIAVGWLWFGLSQSTYIPLDTLPAWEMGFLLEGESILMKLFTTTLVGTAPDGYIYKLTEAAFAGWVGMLVTAINLLPIGQLDGGHIAYGLGQKRQHLLGFLSMCILLVLGFQSMIWWVFAAFGIVFGVKHPPTLSDYKKPGDVATGMGIIALIILVISFTPVPFR